MASVVALFVAEFEGCGGPRLDIGELERHLAVYVAMMGLAWMLDAPRLIQAKVPDLAAAEHRLDARIQESERARSQLLIMTTFLSLWEREDMSRVLDVLAGFD